MSWPNSPLTSYNFDAAPPIKSFDLNQIQDAINRIINGTYTLRSVVVDGTGGNITAGIAGDVIADNDVAAVHDVIAGDSVRASANVYCQRVVFPNNIFSYPLSTDSINNLAINGNQCKAWGIAHFETIGDSFDSIGCQISYAGVGATSFDVTLNDAMASSVYSIVLGLGSPNVVLLRTTSISSTGFTISLRDLTNTPVIPGSNTNVSFAIFGRQT